MFPFASPQKTVPVQDDRILLQTRLVLIVVVPVLILAFLILYVFPDQYGDRFAWKIQPHMTSVLIGSGYLGGAYMFVFATFGRKWHRVTAAFPPVTSFTIAMLLATFLHWDKFDINHFAFQLWLILYVITPILIPYLWIKNRVTDPGTPEPNDKEVPHFAKWAFQVFGIVAVIWAVIMFVFPQFAIDIWPWKLSPLTARVLGGWFSLLGIGGLSTGHDSRWSAWRIPLQSITLWATLVMIGAFMNPSDFASGVWNSFTIGTLLSILMLVIFQVWMETQRNQSTE
jgi:peptidoglycan/LPS O-acetylase OafA/YrhL